MRLENKIALITGSASGMGKSMAELFTSEGARVIIADYNFEGAQAVADALNAEHGEHTAVAVKVDVSNEEQVNQMIDRTLEEFGRMDILVNNAGIMDFFEPVGELETDKWNRIFDINVKGAMYAMRKAVNVFLKQEGEGVIINIASVAGMMGGRAGAAYTAAKHAMVGLSKNTAFMYGPDGIRTNVVCPGGVKTPIVAFDPSRLSKKGYERMSVGVGLSGPMAEPQQIANVALFLASDEASNVNGAVVAADGGFTTF